MDVFDLKRPIFKEKRLPAFSIPFFFFSQIGHEWAALPPAVHPQAQKKKRKDETGFR